MSILRFAVLSGRVLVTRGGSRGIHGSARRNAASNFAMPALSPTMTEGGISAWKVKEGDSFSAGDVLIEIETDKATMDVEAPDDGILVKIYKPNGAKDVPVGTSIGVIAEPGDDLASLELPKPVDSSKASAAPSSGNEEPEPSSVSAPVSAPVSTGSGVMPGPASTNSSTLATGVKQSSPAIGSKADPGQVLFPSVLALLQAHKISKEEALTKISPSGPKGRLTKGDVLAYVGAIPSESVVKLLKAIKSRETLDLSNIKLADPVKPMKEQLSEKPTVPIQAKPVIDFYDLLTFNPPQKISKTLIRPAQVVEQVAVSPSLLGPLSNQATADPVLAQFKLFLKQCAEELNVAEPSAATDVLSTSVSKSTPKLESKLSRNDEIFLDLVSSPKRLAK
ncbi:uncharacterized protein V1516DRAFT_676191 [Lipomyces oligophaga]|uniref:uncharacterized protein n=1 Tax=Lipomyces oligophaga TaxID=45792 RepID=UPI0034CFC0A4